MKRSFSFSFLAAACSGLGLTVLLGGCNRFRSYDTSPAVAANAAEPAPGPIAAGRPVVLTEGGVPPPEEGAGPFVGFDRNIYPGDDRLPMLRQHFRFAGYWLNSPPGATTNSWQGKRQAVAGAGLGFLVLFNGRLDAEIKHSKVTPSVLGAQDGKAAILAAQREGFPAGTIVFLDQEEGGRLLPEQLGYFFGWTEAVAASRYKAGAYLSGQTVNDGTGPDGKPVLITTAQDVSTQVRLKHLHPVALWVVQDGCPPSSGCSVAPPALLASGTPDAVAWQYAQSPRRPALTASCAKSYAADNNCYGGASTDLFLDLDAAGTADPSHGR